MSESKAGDVRYTVQVSGKTASVHREILKWTHDERLAEFYGQGAEISAREEAGRRNAYLKDRA